MYIIIFKGGWLSLTKTRIKKTILKNFNAYQIIFNFVKVLLMSFSDHNDYKKLLY